MLTAQPGSAVPDGTLPVFAPIPTDESVGYFLSPCWAGAHSKSCSIYSIAPANFTLSCAPTKLTGTNAALRRLRKNHAASVCSVSSCSLLNG